jgi:signal transduction histidine kinase
MDRLPAGYARVFRPATATAIVPLQAAGSTLGLLVCDRSGSGASMDGSVGELLNYAALCTDLIERDRLARRTHALTVAAARRDAIARERSRLWLDLHDVKNILTARVRWELEDLEDAVLDGDLAAAGRVLESLRPVMGTAISDLELTLDDLRDQVLEREGLASALAARATLLGRDKVRVSGVLPDDVPSDIESLLFRAGVEGINNALKHSGVKERIDGLITVQIQQENGTVGLTVHDNGTGYDVAAMWANPHKYGLRRLKDRVEAAKGTLTAAASEDGASLCVVLPVTKQSV